ncbi:colicin V production protein [Holospora obtusa F1]|uniref:Colicin V production protein n=1 Tax=Holospora obtusa F1 TaxID=1399147 RepID=W6TTL0_HOLOB|nr:CvpA family protein [Holospora obtusa]ETZ07127.1 colicin V production protein [Holospora obtusa F1]
MSLLQDFNVFDGLLLTVMIFSGCLGFFRGFVKETLSLLAWGTSGVLSWRYHEVMYPFLSKWITSPTILKVSCYVSIFLGMLVIFLCFVQWIALKIRSSIMASVDSSLGIVFGVCRGVVVILGVYMFSLFFVVPGQQPTIIKISKSEKWLNHGTIIVEPFLPDRIKTNNFVQSMKLILQGMKKTNTLMSSPSMSGDCGYVEESLGSEENLSVSDERLSSQNDSELSLTPQAVH